MPPLARVAAAWPYNGKHPPKLRIDSDLTVSNEAVEGGLFGPRFPLDVGSVRGRAAVWLQEVLGEGLPWLMLQVHLQVVQVLGEVVLALLHVGHPAMEAILTQLERLLTQPQGLETLSHQCGEGVE